MSGRRWLWVVAGAMGLAAAAAAQPPGAFNQRVAVPVTTPQDREDVWNLELHFKDPRVLTLDIPGRGRTTVWYLWYQVVNRTGAPQYFRPAFELVTLDKNTVHADEVLPIVQEAIGKQEDKTEYFKIKNSVSIGEAPVPATKQDANPAAVTGVAIFPDVANRAGDTTRLSVFVSGLSNGWTIDDKGVIRRKTLQLNFKRAADAKTPDAPITFVEPATWIYRATTLTAEPTPVGEKKETPKADEEK